MTVAKTLSPAQEKLLADAKSLEDRGGEHGLLVSGHGYRTAWALARRGLGTLTYQGPSMGWFRASTAQ